MDILFTSFQNLMGDFCLNIPEYFKIESTDARDKHYIYLKDVSGEISVLS